MQHDVTAPIGPATVEPPVEPPVQGPPGDPVEPPVGGAPEPVASRPTRRVLPRREGLVGRLAYAVLGVPLAAGYAALFAALLGSAVLAVYGVGIVLVVLVLMVVRGCGGWERALARRFAGVDVPDAPAVRHDRGVVRRLRLVVTSGSTWRTLAWLGVRVLVSAAVLAALVLTGAAAAVLLAYSYSLDLPRHLLLDLLSVVLAAGCVLVAVHVLDLATRGLAVVAPTLLGAGAEERIAAMRRASVRVAGRTAVARDLHDTIGHSLTASLVQAEAAQRALAPRDGNGSEPVDLEFARAAMGHIEDNTRQALAELDRALAVLGDPSRAGDLDEQPPDLRDVAGLLAGLGDAGLEVELSLGVPAPALPQEVSRLAYRVVQEGTTNVLRHAGLVATRIDVVDGGDRIVVRLRNAAGRRTPAPPGRNGGHGLAGLRERAEELGGSLHAGPTEDGGFELVVELPTGAMRE
ncbi:sensor domain-containing protein [Nocardioides sp. S-58]|uniref:histidine kinase n=1 Tax=Nocardioides renjunii TaxID=3095075 RepID=A0ABU5K5N6_9ACTN|nr:sensor domain-containing protein [Nocardioides sp. S-58]MDZ5660212.1 sensor domain-containing protein [Nocardioides sp. S-58]